MIQTYYKSVRDDVYKQLDSYRAGCWIDVTDAGPDDLREVARLTGLEYNDLEDILDRYEVPRLERQEEGLLLFLRSPVEGHEGLHTEVVMVVLTDQYLITISPQENDIISSLRRLGTELATTQQSRFLINIFLRVVRDYTYRVREVRNNVVKKRRRVKKVSGDDIVSLIDNEEILNQYLSALAPMRNVLEALLSGRYISLYEEDEELLNDLLIAINQAADLCKVNLRSIQSVRDSYQIIFTNSLNRTMKFLASLTIVLTIPTIISSIYGMNIRLPLAGHDLAFYFLLALAFSLSAITWLVFVWRDWL